MATRRTAKKKAKARAAKTRPRRPKIDPERLPGHVAIILDGNGRWAKQRKLSRSEGHQAGGEALDRLLDTFLEMKVPAVSLYAFSTENWKRPRAEVKAIWNLMAKFFDSRLERCIAHEIRVIYSGDISRLPAKNRRLVEKVVNETARFSRLTANFCVNYGSQAEILRAAELVLADRLELARAGKWTKAEATLKKKEFESKLYTYGLPDVDLLVRPGGEWRVSNFLLWQIAYAEIYVTDTLWPDFDEEDFFKAVEWYQNRHRRFGGL